MCRKHEVHFRWSSPTKRCGLPESLQESVPKVAHNRVERGKALFCCIFCNIFFFRIYHIYTTCFVKEIFEVCKVVVMLKVNVWYFLESTKREVSRRKKWLRSGHLTIRSSSVWVVSYQVAEHFLNPPMSSYPTLPFSPYITYLKQNNGEENWNEIDF